MSRPRVVDTADRHRVEMYADVEDGREVLVMLVYQRQDRGDECVAAITFDPADLRYLMTGEG